MATYYVAVDGDDGNPGMEAQPFCTIQRAAHAAQQPGDTVYVRTGTYVEDRVTIQHSGTENAPIVFLNAPGELPILHGSFRLEGKSYVHVIGFDIDANTTQWAAIYIKSGSQHCLVDDCTLHDTRGSCIHAIMIYASHHNTIRNNTIYHNNSGLGLSGGATYNTLEYNHCYENDLLGGNSDGISLSTATTQFNIIQYNIVHNNSDDGIDTWTSKHNLIVGNIAYHNGYDRHGNPAGDGNGFKLGGPGGGGNLVINNIAYDNLMMGFTTNGGPLPNTLYHNTAYGNLYHGFEEWEGSGGSTFRNNIGYLNARQNCCFASDTEASHNLYSGNPLFVNAANDDFHLCPGSPAIDMGVSLSQSDIPGVFLTDVPSFFRDEALRQIETDLGGDSRPQQAGYDIGAYEYGLGLPEKCKAPRFAYVRRYVLLPQSYGAEWGEAAARGGHRCRLTVGYSADDAGLGVNCLSEREVLAVNPDEWEDDLQTFFDIYYPGVVFTPLIASTPGELEILLAEVE